MIVKATQQDIADVAVLYERALDYEDSHTKYTSWQRGIYPTADTARAGVKHGSLYIMREEGVLLASAILDSYQPPEYRGVDWGQKLPYDKVLVLHTLCVNPDYAGTGVGTRMLDFAKALARERNCLSLRLNTGAKNTPALGFYKKNGFSVADTQKILLNGQISCPGHVFLFYDIE